MDQHQQTSTSPTDLVHFLRSSFEAGKTRPIEYRRKMLQNLLNLYQNCEKEMCQVLYKDLGKSRNESILTEIEFLINDLKNVLWNLDDWTKPEYPAKSIANILDKVCIYNEPYGVVLIIGSWNYPIQLTLLPVAAAIAAGNCVLIKPSEISSNSTKFIANYIPKYLDSDCYRVFEGGIPETTALLKERFDYIFFTGAAHVGRIVHAAANRYLTPCTLELGGKSPVYIDNSVDLKTSARRILWGKCLNAGQTCVAPDYVLCTKEVQDKFVKIAREVLQEWFGNDPKSSEDLGRIISSRQYERLVTLVRTSSTKIAHGGNSDPNERYIEPTILADVKPEDGVMKEEIFGPILPIMTVSGLDEAVKYIRSQEKPLVLYIFSNKSKDVHKILDETSSGGVVVNDTIMHLATDLPFGGVGMSGMGQYHAKYTFDTFTHKKSCLHKDLGFIGETLGSARYPPLTQKKTAFLKFLLKRRRGVSLAFLPYLIAFFLGVGFTLNRENIFNYVGSYLHFH